MIGENQVVFGVSPKRPDGVRVLLLGVTTEAWNYMKDGKSHTFDFNKAGIPWQVVMYGAPDHAAAKKMIEGFIADRGEGYLDLRREDFKIENASPEELEALALRGEAEAARLLAVARRHRRAARNLRNRT